MFTRRALPPADATVGTESVPVVALNSSRRGLVLINLSANTISLGLGADAVIDKGITLKPNGSWEMDIYTYTGDAITAVASGGSSKLAVQEFE